MIPLSIPAWCDSKPHFSSTRLRNLTVTLWLVIPYSFQKVAKSGFGLASFSFFQSQSPQKPRKTWIQHKKETITEKDHSSCSSAIKSCTPKAIAYHVAPSASISKQGDHCTACVFQDLLAITRYRFFWEIWIRSSRKPRSLPLELLYILERICQA